MKIVVDTNIVFSGVLNTFSRIGKLLISSHSPFRFYSCDFLQAELLEHRPRLVKLTKLSEDEVIELISLVTARISFINEGLLPRDVLLDAESLLVDIDPNDTPFVALAKHLDAKLWTGDMELYHGLKAGGFTDILTTAELLKLLDELEPH